MSDYYVEVKQVRPLEPFKAAIEFTDGTCREVDLEPYMHGSVFEPIRHDLALFRAMYVEAGTLMWPGEVDLDPDALYYGLKPAWMVNALPSDAWEVHREPTTQDSLPHDIAEAS